MEVLALANDIGIAVEVGMSVSDTEVAISTLLSRIGADLFAEEYLMHAADYPALHEQQAAHREFATQLSEAFSAFRSDAETGLDRLLGCVYAWAWEHGATMDRQLANYLRELTH